MRPVDRQYPVVGFTAARRFDHHAKQVTAERLTRLSRGMRRAGVIRPKFITGAARGGDAFIGHWLVTHWLETADHLVLVPAWRSQVDWWWTRLPPRWRQLVVVEYMPEDTDFAYRNKEVVRRADHVEGFPDLPEDQAIRSGTWQTLRLAQDTGTSNFFTIVGASVSPAT